MSILSHVIGLSIYEDPSVSNNPFFRYVDWKKSQLNVEVSNPLSQKFEIEPDDNQIVFSGTRATSIDGTTVFSIALNTQNSSVYRVTRTAGTQPAFRTDRALTLSGSNITVAINNNATATFTTSAGDFNAVQVGDIVFVPDTTTGDSASPFNVLNVGFWAVLARTASVLTMTRLVGESFSGVAEVVALTANSQLQAFSSSGVQVGDTVEISAGFSAITQKSFVVSTVTPSFFEFVSTESLPLETGIQPTASGLVFYNQSKRFVRIEADQECVVRFNGDSSNTVRLSPRVVGDRNAVAWIEKWGPTWSLEVVNRSRVNSVNVYVISAE